MGSNLGWVEFGKGGGGGRSPSKGLNHKISFRYKFV